MQANKAKVLNVNVDKQSQKYSGLSRHLSLPKSEKFEVEFELFRIIFTLPKLKQKLH